MSITIESGAFIMALRRAEKEIVDIDFPKYLRTQARGALRQIMAFTPPKTAEEGAGAIQRDIDRAIKPLKESDWKNEQVKKMIREKNVAGLQRMFKNSKNMKATEIVSFSPSWHINARNKYGKTRKTYKATLDTEAHAAYVKKVQKRSGWALAGWGAAAKDLKVRRKPFVSRHGDHGTFVEINNRQGKLGLTLTNPNVKIPTNRYERTVRDALDSRARTMEMDINRIIKGGAHKFGLTTK